MNGLFISSNNISKTTQFTFLHLWLRNYSSNQYVTASIIIILYHNYEQYTSKFSFNTFARARYTYIILNGKIRIKKRWEKRMKKTFEKYFIDMANKIFISPFLPLPI
jgi:hypothetical protein